MHTDPRTREGAQRLECHDRAQVRSADTDVDDIGDALTGRTAPCPGQEACHELPAPLALGSHGPAHVGTGNGERLGTGAGPQRGVERRPALGMVDQGPAEHRLDGVRQAGLTRRGEKRRARRNIEALPGVIEDQTGAGDGELAGTCRIRIQNVPERRATQAMRGVLQIALDGVGQQWQALRHRRAGSVEPHYHRPRCLPSGEFAVVAPARQAGHQPVGRVRADRSSQDTSGRSARSPLRRAWSARNPRPSRDHRYRPRSPARHRPAAAAGS